MVKESISDEWELTTLSQICQIRNFENSSSELYVGLEHIGQGNNLLIGKGNRKDFKSNKNSFQKNDILYGKLRPNLNKVWLATKNGYCSTDILCLQINEKIINTILLQIISSLKFVNYAVSLSGGTKMPRAKWNDIKNFELLLPPISEQEKIEQIILDVNKLIYQLSKLIEKKKNIKKGVMQELLTGKRRLEGFSDVWETKQLRECGKILMGQSPSGSSYNTKRNGVPLLNGAIDLKENGIFVTQFTSKPTRISKKGDLLFCIRATIGNLQVSDNEYCIGRGVSAFTVDEDFDTKFVTYQLQDLFELMRRKSEGGVIKGLRKDDLAEFEINIPKDIEEQEAISQILSAIDLEIEQLEKKKEKYKMIKEGMMQKLLTGEIRIK